MLKHLSIKNFVLIDNIDVDFHSGFSVVTGETGAGKSIFLGALSLLLGNRASGKINKVESEKTILEATFTIKNFHLKSLFEENNLDYADETIIRREILPNGKTRGFVNDTPVNVSALKIIGDHLLDIHSQNDNLWLNNPDFQLSILDSLADTDELLTAYQNKLAQYTQVKQELETLKKNAAAWQQEKDYLQFQFDQLEKANLQAGEQEEITKELELLNHFEEINLLLNQVESEFYESDDNILLKIERTKNDLAKISDFFSSAKDWHSRMESIAIELNDLISEITTASADMSFDPERQAFLKERMDLIYSLEQKHHVSTIDELLTIKETIDEKLGKIENVDEDIQTLQKVITKQLADLKQQAKMLSAKRNAAIPAMENKVVGLIKDLGIKNGEFKIDLTYAEEDFSETGSDQIQFLFNANKEGTLQPVQQVASGGELSRLMLAVKSLLVTKKKLPTIIFDEIDTGVSGGIASGMGKIMKKMAGNLQLIVITHLPQIAALGSHHYSVEKTETDKHTFISVNYLDDKKRVAEIAKMLSTGKITESSLKNAEELLKH